MNMNYFRLMFCRWGECLVHFAEWKDTVSGESFRLLYLSENEELVNQREGKTEHTLFLCPKSVDLLVLGENNGSVLSKTEELTKKIAVDTLVYPGSPGWSDEKMDGVIKRVICMDPQAGEKKFSVSAAGWKLSVRCAGKSALVVMYEPEQERMKLFDDCVMSVKRISETARCRVQEEPDEYGCALGCARRGDYDVCGCEKDDQGLSGLLGTMLFPMSGILGDLGCLSTAGDSETTNDFESAECSESMGCFKNSERSGMLESPAEREFMEAVKKHSGNIRFFVLTDAAWKILSRKGSIPLNDCRRRYFINTKTKLSGSMPGEVCETGISASPLLLQEGQGLCCSGFLKYIE